MNLQQWLHCETSILLSWILLHSLWQLTLLGLITAILRAIVPMKSQTRYAFSYVMLLCMAAAPLGTLLFIPAPATPIAVPVVVESPQPELTAETNFIADSPRTITLPATEIPLINRPLPLVSTPVAPSITAILPQTEQVQQAQQPANTADFKTILIEYSVWLTPFWLGGVLILLLRQLGGWVLTRRVLKSVIPITDSYLQSRVLELAETLKLRRAIKLVQSTLADVPMVIGVFRPVLILPACLLTGLTPTQCDAILAHELAHIRRYDFLLNLMQVIIETLLFYHPAIWWISRKIRLEREFCCDDIAAQFSGQRIALAEGLAAIEASRQEQNIAPLAVTALGNKKPGVTYRRIKRILNPASTTKRGYPMKTIGSLFILTILLITAAGSYRHANAVADSDGKKSIKVASVDTESAGGYSAIRCRVYDSQGNHVAGAEVQSYTRRHRVNLLTGGKQESPRCPSTTSNAQGKFGLPNRKESYRILVTHKSGVASMTHSELIQSQGRINLQPWARVEGVFTVEGKPQANKKMTLSMTIKPWNFSDHAGRGRGWVNLDYSTTTDRNGKFSFESVPPFSGKVNETNDHQTQSKGVQFTCQAGNTTHLSFESIRQGESMTSKPLSSLAINEGNSDVAFEPFGALPQLQIQPVEVVVLTFQGNPFGLKQPFGARNSFQSAAMFFLPNTKHKPESWELSQRYDAKWMRTWFATHDALPDPITVPAVQGTVVGSDGANVAGAIIQTYTPGEQVTLANKGVQASDANRPVLSSDTNGKFKIAERTDPYRLLITHKTGVALLTHEELINNQGKVFLLPWAKIEGTFISGSTVQANKKIKLYFDTSPWSFSDVSFLDPTKKTGQLQQEFVATTDERGHFTFENVPPLRGRIYVSHKDGFNTNGMPFSCEPGNTSSIKLGKGRSIKGRFRLIDAKTKIDWTKTQLILSPFIDPPPYPRDVIIRSAMEIEAWLEEWIKTKDGQVYANKMKRYPDLTTMNYPGEIDQEGLFTVHGVSHGKYMAFVRTTSTETICPTYITIDSATGPLMDLGMLYLESFNARTPATPVESDPPPSEVSVNPKKPEPTPAEPATKPQPQKEEKKEQPKKMPEPTTNTGKVIDQESEKLIDDKKVTLQYRGKVIAPDGSPVAGAKIYAVYHVPGFRPSTNTKPRAITDAEGMFSFSETADDFEPGADIPYHAYALIAVADGFGFASGVSFVFETTGQSLKMIPTVQRPYFTAMLAKKKPVMQLVQDDVPITGRIVNTKGEPVKGARVRVDRVWHNATNNLDAWEQATKKDKADFYSLRTLTPECHNGVQMPTVIPDVITDAKGHFTLRGVGHERIVKLLISGPGIESSMITARTREGDKIVVPNQWKNQNLQLASFPNTSLLNGTYLAANFTYTANLSNPVVGRVTDAETGKPVAGALVSAGTFLVFTGGGKNHVNDVTDADGQYRLEGLATNKKKRGEQIYVHPPADIAYLPVNTVASIQSGQTQSVLNIKLQKGVWVRGQAIDDRTGNPIQGLVKYYAFKTNPNLKSKSNKDFFGMNSFERRTDKDGHFEIPVLPGKGIVTFMAYDHTRYRKGVGIDTITAPVYEMPTSNNGTMNIFQVVPSGLSGRTVHILKEINPKVGAGPTEIKIVLTSGVDIPGRMVDENGESLDGGFVTGIAYQGLNSWGSPIRNKQFHIQGYDPDQPRKLLAYHPQRNLVGNFDLKGKPPSEIVIHMKPAGSVQGRLVDAAGKPVADVILSGRGIPRDNGGVVELRLATDKDGRFLIKGLVPGKKYTISGRSAKASGQVLNDISVQAGETKNAGDIKFPPAAPKKPDASSNVSAIKSKPENEDIKEQPKKLPEPITYTGKVIDQETGKPIANATVEVSHSLRPDPVTGTNRALQTTTHKSDQNGEYHFTLPAEEVAQSNLFLRLSAYHPQYNSRNLGGYNHSVIRKHLDNGDKPFFDTIKLTAGEEISGLVVQPDGTPAIKTQIIVFSSGLSDRPIYDTGINAFQKTQTDNDGRFKIVVQTPGDGVLWIHPKSFSPLAHRIGDHRGDIGTLKLQQGTRLQGQVLDTKGNPIANVPVDFRRHGDGKNIDDLFLLANGIGSGITTTTKTNKQGQFYSNPLPPGTYTAEVINHFQDPTEEDSFDKIIDMNHVYAPIEITIEAGKTNEPIEIRAVPHLIVRGRYFDSKGKPVSGHRQYLFGKMGSKPISLRSTQPDNDGWFEFKVQKGVQEARIVLLNTGEGNALRWRTAANAPFSSGEYANFGTLTEDITSLEIIQYAAPTLFIKGVYEDGEQLDVFWLITKYKKKTASVSKAPSSFGGPVSYKFGDIIFAKQSDGRWRSSGMLPDEEATISLEKEGFTTQPQVVSLKEGEQRELVFVFKKKPTPAKQSPKP